MSDTRVRAFRVGTFAEGTRKLRAYTLWYNASWEGCVEYVVRASSGAEAKKIAIRKRQALEETLKKGDKRNV